MNDAIWNGTRYFFRQTEPRRNPRREKKNLDDLPPGIRYTKSKANTTSSTRSGEDLPDGVSDVPTQDAGAEVPELKESFIEQDTVGPVLSESIIAPSLPYYQEDSQRLVFENYRSLASLTLTRLGELLEFFTTKRHPIRLPQTLQVALLYEFRDLSSDAIFLLREWQTLSAKQSWDNECKRKIRNSSEESKSVIDSLSLSGGDFQDRQMKPDNSGRLSATPSITGGSRSKLSSRSKNKLGLGNISEDEEDGKGRTSRANSINTSASAIGKRTRLERFKPMIDQMSKTTLSDRAHRRDDFSVLNEGDSENSVKSVRGYYVSVIQFALSSRDCEEKGWIVHDGNSADLERQTVLEWARQRLHTSMRHKEEQEFKERELGHDKRVEIVYYGEPKREKRHPGRAADQASASCPPIPQITGALEPVIDQPPARVMSATTIDGSTSVYYPSGMLGVMSSQAGLGRQGFYVNVYDDTLMRGMLANFTPCGRGACYHKNGVVRFLSTDKEVILSDENGACTKRWPWPPTMKAKLPATIQIQLNQFVVFRCMSRSQMSLTFTHGKQTVKFNMTHALVQPEPEDHGKFQSGIVFSSNSAKEISRASRHKSVQQQRKDKKKKEKKLEKEKADSVDGEGRDSENAFELESERDLHDLSTKIKTLVSGWMLHYRTSVASGKLCSPSAARRSKSAKSTPGDIMRQLDPAPPRVGSPTRRAETAPAGRDYRPHTATTRSKTSFRLDGLGQLSKDCRPAGAPSPSKSPRGPAGAVEPPSDDQDEVRRAVCPVALCRQIQGEDDWTCRCSKHHIPPLTDVEYDTFIQRFAPPQQMIVVCVTSSHYPRQQGSCETTLEAVYSDMNRNRSNPCTHSLSDPFRLFRYDIATCTGSSDHTQPLLLWRHNVIPGMILMYQGGKLLFCDHIFNGYGNARKDFTKQVLKTRREARATGASLPDDFRFSPQMGRRGARSAWGGQIGGAGVDRYASPGLDARGSYLPVRRPSVSSQSTENSLLPACGKNRHKSLTAETLLSSGYATSLPSQPVYSQESQRQGQKPPCLTAH